MGLNSEDPIKFIQHLLESKSTAKQTAYKHICRTFSILFEESKSVVEELKRRAKPTDKDVTVEFTSVNAQEFDVKLAGDMLMFVMGTNIVTLDESHPIMQEDYIKENEVNRYFGQIMVYNFMAESLKYNRTHDPGYLLARLMVNHECRFFIEGERELEVYNRVSEQPISEEDLKQMVKIVLKMAIENDLVAPPFIEVKSITLNQKRDHIMELGGQKIGFRMSYEPKTEG
jgi:hypothetical protein